VASGATGTATVTLDAANMVTVTGTFAGLSSNAVAAHIHGPAPVGMNAGIIVNLTATAAPQGTVTGSGTLTAAQRTDMLGGLTYINVHSANNTGGEIRGQIVP
jgi:hypothetical protein